MPSFQPCPSSIYLHISFSYAVALLFFAVPSSQPHTIREILFSSFSFLCVALIIPHILVSIRIRRFSMQACMRRRVIMCVLIEMTHRHSLSKRFAPPKNKLKQKQRNNQTAKYTYAVLKKALELTIRSNHSWWPNVWNGSIIHQFPSSWVLSVYIVYQNRRIKTFGIFSQWAKSLIV